MRPAVTEALSRRLGTPVQVAVTVQPPAAPEPDPASTFVELLGRPEVVRQLAEVPAAAGRR